MLLTQVGFQFLFSNFVLICLTLLIKTIAVLTATFIYRVYTAVRQPYCSPLLSTLRSAPYLNITMANPRFMHLSTYGVGYTWSSAGGTEAITGVCGKIEGRWRRKTEKVSGRGRPYIICGRAEIAASAVLINTYLLVHVYSITRLLKPLLHDKV